jgi:hypothetical protein
MSPIAFAIDLFCGCSEALKNRLDQPERDFTFARENPVGTDFP